jgi:hypothetical protein
MILTTLILAASLSGQVHAPAGGAYGSNGQFYKGGQFMPGGGGLGFGAYAPSPWYVPEVPPARAKARTRLRQGGVAGQSRGAASDANRSVGAALSRLEMARSLAAAGRRDDARGWLDRVIKMDASPETVGRAREMLASLDPGREADADDGPRRGVCGNAILQGIGARR